MQIGRIGKIVAAGTLAAIMVGSSAAMAQLQNFPSPFVTSAGPQSLVVVGAAAAPSDVVGAIDIAARLGGEVTTDVAVPGASAVNVVGEGRSLHTANKKIYLGDNLRKTGLRTAMSSTDLPNVLKSGQVTDTDAGATYDYDQFVDFSDDFALQFNKISGDLPDPTYLFGELGTSASTTSFLYRTRIVFNDEVNITTVAGEKINLFGKQYTFSSDSTSTKVVLFGASETLTMSEGEEATVNVGGQSKTIKLVVVSSASVVAVQVGSDSKSINKGSTATVGGVEIFVDDVFFSSKETVTSSAKLGIGARKLIIQNNTQVKTKVGEESEKTVDGTLGIVTTSGVKITGIDVYVVGDNSRRDFLAVGGKFPDTVWKSFSVDFPSMSVGVKDAARDLVKIEPSGTRDINLVFTNDRGNSATVKWAHTISTRAGGATTELEDDSADDIVVTENATIQRNNYFIVDAGDFSRMFELTSTSSLGTSDGKLEIRDVFSGNTIDVNLGADGLEQKIIDGQTYFFNTTGTNSDTPNVRVTWGTNAGFGAVGDFQTVYPVLKSQRGLQVALMNTTVVTPARNGTVLQLPTGALNMTWNELSTVGNLTLTAVNTEDGDSTSATTTTVVDGASRIVQVGRTSTGGAFYNITNDGFQANAVTVRPASSSTATVNNATLLLIEEQDDNNNLHTVLAVGGTELRSSSQETSPTTPTFSDGNAATGRTSDANSDIELSADLWGTYVETNTRDQNKVSVWYPDEQVSANVFVLAEGASVSTSGSAGGTVKAAVPIKSALGKLDTEVTDADKNTKNLILVGGPAVNTLVAQLGTAGKTRDLAWYRSQGAGTALVDYVADAFVTGKAALVVAGHSAADSRVAASKVQNFDTAGMTGSEVVLKNGVITTTTA